MRTNSCSHFLTNSIAVVFITIILGIGCAKEPGIGGRAEIHGRVLEQHQGSGEYYPKQDHRVYIVYGDGSAQDDDVRTGADGRFRFPWLRKGNYKVYTLSECEQNIVDCPSGTFPVSRDVDLVNRTDLVDVGDLLITNW